MIICDLITLTQTVDPLMGGSQPTGRPGTPKRVGDYGGALRG